MRKAEQDQVLEWTDALIAEEIGEEDFGKLGEMLRESAEARALYLEHRSVDSMLRWEFEDGVERVEAPEVEGAKIVRFPVGWRGAVAGAAAAMVIGFGSFWFGGVDRDADPGFAVVESAEGNAQWRWAGSGEGNRTLHVDAGRVRVSFSSGAVAEVEGVAVLGISGENAASLEWGKATFRVPAAARGFEVRTPLGKVVDLGTAFEVEVGGDGVARVAVLEGVVRASADAGGAAVRLGEGESIEIAASGLLSGGGKDVAVTAAESGYARAVRDAVEEMMPVAYWDFSGEVGETLTDLGGVTLVEGPRPPEFGQFEEGNTAASFDQKGVLRKQDRGEGSEFDFENGDEITLEAWVYPDGIEDDQNIYIVGKGRTNNVGFLEENQNFSLRLRGQNNAACVSFLFRSEPRGEPGGDLDFHRWTSREGFAVGSGWHHVAVSYRFGEPESVRGYLDGERVAGDWDMGGATTRAPVVDDDEIWLGAGRGGAAGNSFSGRLDEVAIFRKIVDSEKIRARSKR